MIAFVRGEVADVGLTSAVVEVGGVGLEVLCTPGTLATLRAGQQATLPTSMVVREDSLTLFGFLDDDEKQTFELVQTASGVGPKLAQAMLAVLSPDDLRRGGRARGRQDADPGARASGRRARSGSSSSCATGSAPPTGARLPGVARGRRPDWRGQVQRGPGRPRLVGQGGRQGGRRGRRRGRQPSRRRCAAARGAAHPEQGVTMDHTTDFDRRRARARCPPRRRPTCSG